MDSPRSLGIVSVSITLNVTLATERLDALLSTAEKNIGLELAAQVNRIVQAEKLGYYPALDYFENSTNLGPELLVTVKALAAQIRKRIKREVQIHLWPVFSSVRIERATTLAFTLPRVSPSQPDALAKLAQHYFPNAVRLELVLTTLDKQHRLDEVERFSSDKVVRHLLDVFESVSVGATHRLSDLADPEQEERS